MERLPGIRAVRTLLKMAAGVGLLLLAGGFAAPAQAVAGGSAQKFTPGMYEGLMLAVDREGRLAGYYRESQGANPGKTCAFFLKGQAEGSQAPIVTWSAEVFPGSLRVDGQDVVLRIERGREHPGCGLVMMPEIATGIPLSKVSEASWIDLKIIRHDCASLYAEPAEDKKTKAYLVRNDVVGVVSVRGAWLSVEFPRAGRKPVQGWLKASDVLDLQPPSR